MESVVASAPGRQRAQPAMQNALSSRRVFDDAVLLLGAVYGGRRPRRAPTAPELNSNGSAASLILAGWLTAEATTPTCDVSVNAQHRKTQPAIMSDQASLLATIAGLQEQIDAMNGQLTEVNAPSFAAPFASARCGRGAPPRPAAPTAAAAPTPSTPPPARPYTPSPARAGRRPRRARDHKTKTPPPAAAPQAHRHGRHRRLLAHLRRRPRLLDAGPRPASARHRRLRRLAATPSPGRLADPVWRAGA